MPEPHPLAVAALQARSVAARAPLARAAEDSWVEGELARVIALQDLRPDDQAEALAILARLRRAGTIAPAHQGLHCQLAYAAGDRTLAATLLDEYDEVPEPIRTAVELDLGPKDWATRFAALLPHPAVRVARW